MIVTAPLNPFFPNFVFVGPVNGLSLLLKSILGELLACRGVETISVLGAVRRTTRCQHAMDVESAYIILCPNLFVHPEKVKT